MESQLQREDHPPYAAGLHTGIEHDEHEHGEKKSVLKKVKDKAKKIKNTITKHGHGHGHGHHTPEEEEDDDDEEEEMVDDVEVHGGPVIESTVISCTNLPRQVDIDMEKPNTREEGIARPSALRPTGDKVPTDVDETTVREPTAQVSRPPDLKDVMTGRPEKTGEMEHVKEPRVRIGPPMGLEEDPHSPKTRPGDIPPSNYQSKVVDPTGDGGKEADVEPLLHRLDNLNLRSERESSKPVVAEAFTGSHDQFAPQSTPIKDEFKPVSEENSESIPKKLDPAHPDTPRDTVAGKISSATFVIADKAVAAKNVVASKLGYGGGGPHQEEGHQQPETHKKPVSETASEYAHVVYDKVAGAGAAVMSKVHGGGVGGVGEHVPSGDATRKETDKGVSVGGYFAEKFKPGDEDKALSEVITDAFHRKKEEKWHEAGKGSPWPLGKVTESEEVAERLGTHNKREGEDALAAGSESSGAGVVDKLKDAVSSWLGKSTGTQTAKESIGQSHVSPGGAGGGGEHGQEALQPRS